MLWQSAICERDVHCSFLHKKAQIIDIFERTDINKVEKNCLVI